MEENNRPAPVATDAQGNNNRPEGAEGKNRRRRGHRGGKKHHEHRERQQQNEQNRQQEAVQENAAATQEAPKPKQNQNANQKQNQGQNQNRQKQHEKGGKDRGKQDNNRGNKQQNRHPKGERRQPDHFAQKDDIYGDLQEEKALAEWRAKIVLNATDNPTPAKAEVEEPTPDPIPADQAEQPECNTPLSAPADDTVERIEVVGIRFRSAGKLYYFDPCGLKPKKGDFAIVETARGPEFGDVCMENTMVKASETITPLRPMIRIATPADVAHNAENREKEKEALPICQKKIDEHKLDMKLIDVQYAFDNSKLLFYFSSEGRVDFRELVKDLASVFRTRIELRQIGIRDEAKMLGGFGSCGRTLCCSTFLPDFAQVSIKMAKEQGLSLNSAKISGMCGRLMCCLRFESEVYAEEIKRTPAVDSTVKTEDGIGTVISTNPLAGTIRVILKDSPDTPPKQYHRNDVTVLGKGNRQSDGKKEEKQEEES